MYYSSNLNKVECKCIFCYRNALCAFCSNLNKVECKSKTLVLYYKPTQVVI